MSVKLLNNNSLTIKKVEIDFSWALIPSTCLAFNKHNILNYLDYCWECIAKNKNLFATTTVLHICSAQIMHRISYNLEKKFKIDKRLKRIIMHEFGSMVNCGHMNDIDQLFELLSKKQTSVYCTKLNELEECIKREINVDNSVVPQEFEEETDITLNAATYKEKSPFGRQTVM